MLSSESLKLRLKAFLVHLVISLAILAVLLYLLVFIWYPPPFFAADGGWQGLKIILGVDIVLGPVLTLMIYNPAKGAHKLKMDLIAIACVQIFALIAGSYIVYDQRTRMVVFANNRFVSLTETQISESNVPSEMLARLSESNPPMAFVELPEDPAERRAVINNNISGQLLYKRGDLFRPLTDENRMKIIAEGFDLDDVATANPARKTLVSRFLDKIKKPSSSLAALPLYCRYAELTLVMDRGTGEIIDTISIPHGDLIASLAAERLKEESSDDSGN
ncbi:MAG: hypothetical protein AAF402_17195 [Pseudomonadota bacterium]